MHLCLHDTLRSFNDLPRPRNVHHIQVQEAAGVVRISVQRTGGGTSSALRVRYWTGGGSATPDEDYASLGGGGKDPNGLATLDFAPHQGQCQRVPAGASGRQRPIIASMFVSCSAKYYWGIQAPFILFHSTHAHSLFSPHSPTHSPCTSSSSGRVHRRAYHRR